MGSSFTRVRVPQDVLSDFFCKILSFFCRFGPILGGWWDWRGQGLMNSSFLANASKSSDATEGKLSTKGSSNKTLPKALRTQALTALTSNFGLIGLVQYVW